jgi:hypothetical protein
MHAAGLSDLAECAAIASQELMANAVLHGCRGLPACTEVVMSARYNGTRSRLEVWDPSTDRPLVRQVGEEEESGRGLPLVASLADLTLHADDDAAGAAGLDAGHGIESLSPGGSRLIEASLLSLEGAEVAEGSARICGGGSVDGVCLTRFGSSTDVRLHRPASSVNDLELAAGLCLKEAA